MNLFSHTMNVSLLYQLDRFFIISSTVTSWLGMMKNCIIRSILFFYYIFYEFYMELFTWYLFSMKLQYNPRAAEQHPGGDIEHLGIIVLPGSLILSPTAANTSNVQCPMSRSSWCYDVESQAQPGTLSLVMSGCHLACNAHYSHNGTISIPAGHVDASFLPAGALQGILAQPSNPSNSTAGHVASTFKVLQ